MKRPEQPQNVEQNGYSYFYQDRIVETFSSEDQLKQRISEFLEIICIDDGAPLRDRLIRWLENGQDIPKEERIQQLVQTISAKDTEEDLTQRMERMSLCTPSNQHQNSWDYQDPQQSSDLINYQGQQELNPMPLPDHSAISTSSYVTTVAPTWQSGQLVSIVWWEEPETTPQINNTGSDNLRSTVRITRQTMMQHITYNHRY